jgi:hypothetical protein
MITISYLGGLSDDFDYVWDNGSNFCQGLSQNQEAIIVNAKFSHEKE